MFLFNTDQWGQGPCKLLSQLETIAAIALLITTECCGIFIGTISHNNGGKYAESDYHFLTH